MPAIYLFGRRTLVGGDDLQPAAYLTIIVRFVQIVLLILPLLYHLIVYHDIFNRINDDNTNTDNNNATIRYDHYNSTNSYNPTMDNDTSSSSRDLEASSSTMTYSIPILQQSLLQFQLSQESIIQQQQQQQSDVQATNEQQKYQVYYNDNECYYSHYFLIFFTIWIISSLLFKILTIWLEGSIVYWSSIGPPIEIIDMTTSNPKKVRTTKVQDLVEYKLGPFSVFLFLIWICGIVAIVYAPTYYKCQVVIVTTTTNDLSTIPNERRSGIPNSIENNNTSSSTINDDKTLMDEQTARDNNDTLWPPIPPEELLPTSSTSNSSSSNFDNSTDKTTTGTTTTTLRGQQELFDDMIRQEVELLLTTTTTTNPMTSSSNSNKRQSMKIIVKEWWWIIPTTALLITQIVEVIVSWMFLFQLWIQPPSAITTGGGEPDGIIIDPYTTFYDATTGCPISGDTTTGTNNIILQRNNSFHDPTTVTTTNYELRRRNNLANSSNNNNNGNNVTIYITNQNHELMEELWERRCANLCHCLSISTCFMFGGRSLVVNTGNNTNNPTERAMDGSGTAGTFGDVARALADYLEGTDGGLLDIVPSDIVMGLIVLQRLQRQRIYQSRQDVLQQKQRIIIQQSPPPSQRSLVSTTTPPTTTTSTITLIEVPPPPPPAIAPITLPNRMNNSTPTRNKLILNYHNPSPTVSKFTSTIRRQESKESFLQTGGATMGNGLLPGNNDDVLLSSNQARMSPNTIQKSLLLHNHDQQQSVNSILTTNSTTTIPPPRDRTNIFRHNYEQGCYQQSSRSILNCHNNFDMKLLQEGARYAKYALAIYTWVLYLYVYPITGPCRLCCYNIYRCYKDIRTNNRRRNCSSSDYGCCCCWFCDNNVDINNGGLTGTEHNGYQSNRHQRLNSSDRSLQSSNSFDRVRMDDPSNNYGSCGGGSLSSFSNSLCDAHKSAILLTAGITEDADIVYLQLKSSFNDIPYCILLDHEWQTVVVTIRGTFSLEDCVTDVLIDPEALEQIGIEYGFDALGGSEYCHGGVLACARNVLRDLEQHHILDELLVHDNSLYSNYTLRFVGHSLGAATATLLSYMLKSKFPTLRCCNYSPPGCTFTWKMATQCQDWCTSYVIDSDLVPRLSLNSMERLRDETLELIARIKVPKIEVTARFVNSSALKGFRLCNEEELSNKEETMNETVSDILYEVHEIPDSMYKRQLERFRLIQDERKRARGTSRSVQLYPPGRIIHIIKTGEQRSCMTGCVKIATCCTTNMGAQYIPIWINNDDLNEIVVSPTMGTDHFPDRIRYILENVAKDYSDVSVSSSTTPPQTSEPIS